LACQLWSDGSRYRAVRCGRPISISCNSAVERSSEQCGARYTSGYPISRSGKSKHGSDLFPSARSESVEKARADVQVARGEAEVPKRDAQLAKADIEKLRAETANLNSALERLQTEKTAAESKARLMVFVACGVTLIALLAAISAILLVNRRRAIAAKRQWAEPDIKPVEVTTHSPAVETQATPDAADLQGAKTGDTPLFSPDLTQPLPSDATAQKSQDESRASDVRFPSDAEEERVTLPI
jgi:hypothetical protein